MAGAGDRPRPRAKQREVDLAGRAMVPAVQLALEHETGAHASPDREEDEVRDAARNAGPALAERREVDVVLEGDRKSQTLAQVLCRALPSRPSTFAASLSLPLRASDLRDADDGTVDEVAVEPTRSTGNRGARQPRSALRRRRPRGARVLSRPDALRRGRRWRRGRRRKVSERRARPPGRIRSERAP